MLRVCLCFFSLSENGPQITYVRDFKAKVQYFRFWCQVRVRNIQFDKLQYGAYALCDNNNFLYHIVPDLYQTVHINFEAH